MTLAKTVFCEKSLLLKRTRAFSAWYATCLITCRPEHIRADVASFSIESHLCRTRRATSNHEYL